MNEIQCIKPDFFSNVVHGKLGVKRRVSSNKLTGPGIDLTHAQTRTLPIQPWISPSLNEAQLAIWCVCLCACAISVERNVPVGPHLRRGESGMRRVLYMGQAKCSLTWAQPTLHWTSQMQACELFLGVFIGPGLVGPRHTKAHPILELAGPGSGRAEAF